MEGSTCSTCKEAITGSCIQVAGHAFHDGCFQCSSCSTRLGDEVFQRDGCLICAACNYPACYKCKKAITDQQVTAIGQKWHLACFCCSKCSGEFEGGRFVKREADQLPYCTPCFDQHFAPRCYGCKKLAKTGCVSAIGQRWHRECLKCATCKMALHGKAIYERAGQPYCDQHIVKAVAEPAPGKKASPKALVPPLKVGEQKAASTPALTQPPAVSLSQPPPVAPRRVTSPRMVSPRLVSPRKQAPQRKPSESSSSAPHVTPPRGDAQAQSERALSPRRKDGKPRPPVSPRRMLSVAGHGVALPDAASLPRAPAIPPGKGQAKGQAKAPHPPLKRSPRLDLPPKGSTSLAPAARLKRTRSAGPSTGSSNVLLSPRLSETPVNPDDDVGRAVDDLVTLLQDLPWFRAGWGNETTEMKQAILSAVSAKLYTLTGTEPPHHKAITTGSTRSKAPTMKKDWAKVASNLDNHMSKSVLMKLASHAGTLSKALQSLVHDAIEITEPMSIGGSRIMVQTPLAFTQGKCESVMRLSCAVRKDVKQLLQVIKENVEQDLVRKPTAHILDVIEKASKSGTVDEHVTQAAETVSPVSLRHLVVSRMRGHLERLVSLVQQTCNALSTIDGDSGVLRHSTTLELIAATQVIVELTVKVQDLSATSLELVRLMGNQKARQKRKLAASSSTTLTVDCNIWHFDRNAREKESWPVGGETLNSMVLALTSTESIVERSYLHTFVLTYRSFATPEKLLSKLIERYTVPKSSREDKATVQLRVCVTLKYWIETQVRDFSPELLDDLHDFMEKTLVKDGNEQVAAMLQNALSQAIKKEASKKLLPLVRSSAFNAPLSPTDMLLNASEQDVAEQLTQISWTIFSSIDLQELLNGAWSKEKLRHSSPNVIGMIKRFNQVSFWVASTVLYSESLKERSAMISRWLRIITCLHDLHNYNGLMGVMAGLTLSPIDRLKFSLSTVHSELLKKFEEFKALMQPSSNWKAYREELAKASLPKIPYLGMYLTDLTFIEDGNPDKLMDGSLINFKKRAMVFNVLDEISVMQSVPFTFAPREPLFSCLLGLPALTESQLYDLSLQREPRGATIMDILH